jgi:hypothetical protein
VADLHNVSRAHDSNQERTETWMTHQCLCLDLSLGWESDESMQVKQPAKMSPVCRRLSCSSTAHHERTFTNFGILEQRGGVMKMVCC